MRFRQNVKRHTAATGPAQDLVLVSQLEKRLAQLQAQARITKSLQQLLAAG